MVTPLLVALCAARQVGGEWTELQRHEGLRPDDGLGRGLAILGDVDGDGLDDYAVAAASADPLGRTDAGIVRVHAGAGGALLWQWQGGTVEGYGGWSLAVVPDVDGDGVPDLAIGEPIFDDDLLAGRVHLRSGADGAPLRTLTGAQAGDAFGHAVAGLPDVDGDGFGEVLVGAPDTDAAGSVNAGAALLHSGATGALLRRHDGSEEGALLGFAVAAIGDVNGDGIADYAAGAPAADPGGVVSGGTALVFDGATGALLHRFDGLTEQAQLGRALAGPGDLDGDGLAEIAVGIPRMDFFAPRPGRVAVFAGADGALLWSRNGTQDFDHFGRALAPAGDFDRDGVPDLLVGAPLHDGAGLLANGVAVVLSGAGGRALLHVRGEGTNDQLGTAVAGGGRDGFGQPELLFGAPHHDPGLSPDGGHALVWGWDPFLTANAGAISSSAGGTVDFVADFPATAAGDAYILLASASGTGPTLVDGVAVPLTQDPFFDAMTQGVPSLFSNPSGFLDAQGDSVATLQLPPGSLPGRIGDVLHFAVLRFTPPLNAHASSVAVPLTVTP